jgi:hypothetical protein
VKTYSGTKRNLFESAVCTAIATTILAIAACGGGNLQSMITGSGPNGSAAVHLATSQRSGSHVYPGAGKAPFLAGFMFASAPAPSQLQQSYDAICNFQPGFLAAVPSGSFVPLAMAGENSTCQFFSGPQPNSGKRTIFDGTVQSLVVTGTTVSGASFQCRDVSTNSVASDNSFTRAYLDPNAHSVMVFNSNNGTPTSVGFTCTGIGSAGDQVASIEAQWAKT